MFSHTETWLQPKRVPARPLEATGSCSTQWTACADGLWSPSAFTATVSTGDWRWASPLRSNKSECDRNSLRDFPVRLGAGYPISPSLSPLPAKSGEPATCEGSVGLVAHSKGLTYFPSVTCFLSSSSHCLSEWSPHSPSPGNALDQVLLILTPTPFSILSVNGTFVITICNLGLQRRVFDRLGFEIWFQYPLAVFPSQISVS